MGNLSHCRRPEASYRCIVAVSKPFSLNCAYPMVMVGICADIGIWHIQLEDHTVVCCVSVSFIGETFFPAIVAEGSKAQTVKKQRSHDIVQIHAYLSRFPFTARNHDAIMGVGTIAGKPLPHLLS